MKGGNDNENRKNYSETEGRGSGLPYGKRRGSQAVQEHRAAGRAERGGNDRLPLQRTHGREDHL